jgi:hypothetical protein
MKGAGPLPRPAAQAARARAGKVEDRDASNRLWRRQARLNQPQLTEGTQRFELPVSKITVKRWGGEPRPM